MTHITPQNHKPTLQLTTRLTNLVFRKEELGYRGVANLIDGELAPVLQALLDGNRLMRRIITHQAMQPILKDVNRWLDACDAAIKHIREDGP